MNELQRKINELTSRELAILEKCLDNPELLYGYALSGRLSTRGLEKIRDVIREATKMQEG